MSFQNPLSAKQSWRMKRQFYTADVVCAAITHWFGCASTVGCSKQLVARAFDLSSAYRQVGLCLEGRNMAYIRL